MANKPTAPSIDSLWSILKLLGERVAKAVLGWGSWDDVTAVLGAFRGWFEFLFWWIEKIGEWVVEEALDLVWEWIAYLDDWRAAVGDTLNKLIAWWTTQVKNVIAWLITAKGKIAYICVTSYSFLAGFIQNYTSWVQAWLGAAWFWVKSFYANPLGTIEGYLGYAWSWLKAFYIDPVSRIKYYLGSAWIWLAAFFADPLGVIEPFLGLAWAWAKSWFTAPLAMLHAIVGGALQFLLDLFTLSPSNILAFVRDALAYWYNIWSSYRAVLLAFLHDPGGFILDMIYDLIEDWVNDWLYDHW